MNRHGPGRPSASHPPLRRSLPQAAWPAADRAAWHAALRPGETALDAPGVASHLQPVTKRLRARAWGNYLSFLLLTGQLRAAESPAERLNFARLSGFIAARRPQLTANSLRRLVLELAFVAAALAPGEDWGWVSRHPLRPSHGEAEASRKPVRPFDAPLLADQAMRLCAEAERGRPGRRTACQYRDGVILLIATHLALRVRNLAMIRIGQHLEATGSGFWLRFEAAEAKSGRPLEYGLPDSIVPLLRRYLEVHRPRLLGGMPDSGALWLGREGAPLASTAFYGLFMRQGQALLGRPLNPHLVRHTMATGLLAANPRAVRTASAGLGHRGTRQLTDTYDRAGREAAQAEWLRTLRQAGRDARHAFIDDLLEQDITE